MITAPDLPQITKACSDLRGRIVRTPNLHLSHDRLESVLPDQARVHLKMELFQQTGSFKARGALLGLDQLSPSQKTAGVVAASGGNHALAVAWAAQAKGIHASIAMPKTADPSRITGCRKMGAELFFTPDISGILAEMDRIARELGATPIHPFEGSHMTLGSATIGTEIVEDIPELDMMIVPVGGGGLISGISAAIKQARPDCEIFGVEPFGADSMFQSFKQSHPVALEKIDTIADSLSAPMALPYSYSITRQFTKAIVRVSDSELISAMRLLYDTLKIAAEPACAASLAALIGPLREQAKGKTIGIIACGSNISAERFLTLTRQA